MIENIQANANTDVHPYDIDSKLLELIENSTRLDPSSVHILDICHLLTQAFPGIELGSQLGKGSFSVAYDFSFQGKDGKGEQCVLKLGRVHVSRNNHLNEERMGGEWMALLNYDSSVLQTYYAIAYDFIREKVVLIDASEVQLMFHNPQVRKGMKLALIGTVSEYISGSLNLSQALANEGAMSFISIQHYAKKMFEGIVSIHAKSHDGKCLIHRDIKPENILITREGELKVIDFGFSKLIEEISMRQTGCGSFLYMAPEVFSHDAYNHKADSYSLGAILSMMATNTNHMSYWFEDLKFASDNDFNLLQDHISRFQVDEELRDLVTKLGEIDPEKRPSVEEALRHPFFTLRT